MAPGAESPRWAPGRRASAGAAARRGRSPLCFKQVPICGGTCAVAHHKGKRRASNLLQFARVSAHWHLMQASDTCGTRTRDGRPHQPSRPTPQPLGQSVHVGPRRCHDTMRDGNEAPPRAQPFCCSCGAIGGGLPTLLSPALPAVPQMAIQYDTHRCNDPGRTRTCNLWFRRPTPYPLGHRAA